MDLEIQCLFFIILLDCMHFLKKEKKYINRHIFTIFFYTITPSIFPFFTVIRSFDWNAISEASTSAILGFGGIGGLTPPVIK